MMPRVEGTLGMGGGVLEPGSGGFCGGRRVWHPDRLPPLPTVSRRLEHPEGAKCVVATGAPGAMGRRLREAGPQNHSSVPTSLIGNWVHPPSDQPQMGSKPLSQPKREPGLW